MKPCAAVVVPIGPGKESALDTLESVSCYCREPHQVVVIDDCTGDGTYEAVVANKQPNSTILRNSRVMGRERLVHTLCTAYRFLVSETDCDLVFRLDQDALVIKPDVITDARSYAQTHPGIGLFGVYTCDYDRPRSFEFHTQLMTSELSWRNRLKRIAPSWAPILSQAERNGYRRGDNVFGGAYFVTRECLAAMFRIGALDVPYSWNSQSVEDVYFSMAAVAAGYQLGHFAAPDGPLCLEWEGLPYPALELAHSKYKVIHSVDKGKNTGRDANDGFTAREVFKRLRNPAADATADSTNAALSSASH